MSVEFVAETNEASIVDFRNTDDVVRSRIDANGTIITAVQTEPTTLAVGECAWWIEPGSTPPKVHFVANISGALKRTALSLT